VKENLKRRNADIIGLIPFDERVVEATRKGVPVVQIGGAASEAITRIWDTTIRPLLLE